MPVNSYIRDAEYIVEIVADVHPRPDFRLGRQGLKDAAEGFIGRARRCERPSAFWQAAQSFMALIGDAHTVMAPLHQDAVVAPVGLGLVAGQIVIKTVMPEYADLVEIGDAVMFINATETFRRLAAILETTPSNYFDYGIREAAARLLQFPDGERERVSLTVGRRNGRVTQLELPLLSVSDPCYQEWQTSLRRDELRRMVEWRLLDGRTGYLRYARCHDRSSPRLLAEASSLGMDPEELPSMGRAAHELFEAVRRAGGKRVIIDIRGNYGGNSEVARPLLNHICRKPLQSYGMVSKVSRPAQDLLRSSPDSVYPPFRPVVEQYLSESLGRMIEVPGRTIAFPYDGSPDTGLPLFDGDVLVLTDSGTFSSGEALAVELRDNGIGTFIGEPTGGGGSVPGDQLDFATPGLGLRFSVSYKLFTRPDRAADRLPAVVPDYLIRPTLDDYRVGKDSVLDWAMSHD